MTSWIHATGVHKGFGRGARRVEVLRGVDLDVEPGEFVTVVGSSGAGKSTLLYCLCGLIPADDGQISLVGNDIRTASRSQLARIRRDHVGFIFQDLNLISSLTVRDNVVLPARMAGRSPRRRDVNQVLDAVGLASQASKYPAHLSGGQRQRVAIARSLLHQPELLLADEPTGSLDVSSRDTVLELLRATVSETTSLVMVTHDLDIAATADRVVVLADGHNDRILTRPSSTEVFQALHTGPRHCHADYTGAS
ncbi:ABC transporter ATP-binding protein [Streptomyces sp. MAG02]|nr:ABC transporter ATP-binding protein [Streptomyces sp. MAG02]